MWISVLLDKRKQGNSVALYWMLCEDDDEFVNQATGFDIEQLDEPLIG